MKNEFLKRILSSFLLLPIIFYIIIQGSIIFNLLLGICFIISVYEWNKICNIKSFKFFGFIFLIISFFSVYLIRFKYSQDFDFFLLIFIICILTDVGGYFFGKLFKGPKLTKISPNKTISGMFGSFFLSILISILLIRLNFFNFDSIQINFSFIFYILCISGVSQLGDIFISYFKRMSNLKDTGKIIPGHGGLLDRIDGMIFAFPFSLLFLNILHITFK